MNPIINSIFVILITMSLIGCGQKDNSAPGANSIENSNTTSSEQTSRLDSHAALYEQAKAFHSGLNDTPVDKAKAFELFSKSADMGNSGAMFFLGVMHERGESVPVDLEKALEWYEKSNKLGCGCAPDSLIKDTKAKIAKAKKK